MMGSIYFEANADFVFDLTREGGGDAPLTQGTVRCTKMKDGVDGWSRTVRFKAVEWESDDEPRNSLAVESILGPHRRTMTPVSEAARVLLACLQSEVGGAEDKRVSWPDWQQARYRHSNPKWQAGDPIPELCKGSTLRTRRKELLDAGCVFDLGNGHYSVSEVEVDAA